MIVDAYFESLCTTNHVQPHNSSRLINFVHTVANVIKALRQVIALQSRLTLYTAVYILPQLLKEKFFYVDVVDEDLPDFYYVLSF